MSKSPEIGSIQGELEDAGVTDGVSAAMGLDEFVQRMFNGFGVGAQAAEFSRSAQETRIDQDGYTFHGAFGNGMTINQLMASFKCLLP